jgi:hypothetical protein
MNKDASNTATVTRIIETDPSWCTYEHDDADWGTRNGFPVRHHQGPDFGPYISTGAEQTLNGLMAPTAMVFVDDGAEMGANELRQLILDATNALEWIEANA